MKFLWEVLGTAVFFLTAGALVLRWLAQSGAPLPAPFSDPLPERMGERPEGRELWSVFGAALAFRAAAALGSLLLFNLLSWSWVGVGGLPELWTRWDAVNYIKLAELGYAGYLEKGVHLFVVFFPLYVWLLRGARLLIPNTALAGMVLSALCFAWGCVYLYRLAAEDYGRKIARRTLVLLSLFPYAFFFGGIMNESLFLLTTAAGLYHIRKHRWGRYALWGILAALSRMQGVLLIGAAGAELFNQVKPFEKEGKERWRAWGRIALRLPLLCAPLLGGAVYLGVNYYATGDPFAFVEMEKHWDQGAMWFPRVLAYLLKNALHWRKVVVRWELWIPELILFPIFALLLWRSWKKHRSMLTLYAYVYFLLTYCLSWLLSAGRYLSCAVPCFLFAADELEGHPRLRRAVMAVSALLQCVFLNRFFWWGQVM